MSEITLTQGMRANLVGLQQTLDLLNKTQTRLATGKRINSAIDDPVAYFAAQSHLQRASDLTSRQGEMKEGINVANAADKGITTLLDLISQAKGIANSALSTAATASRTTYAGQFDDIMDQIVDLAADSGYKGTNLLKGDSLSVYFNETGDHKLDITGFDATSLATLGLEKATTTWSTTASTGIDASLDKLNDATEYLRTQSKGLASSLNIITSRQTFTTSMIDVLNDGAQSLVEADMNEEAANLLALQTRQSLGITSLNLASQAAQSILRLF